jgi:hypothetical protein
METKHEKTPKSATSDKETSEKENLTPNKKDENEKLNDVKNPKDSESSYVDNLEVSPDPHEFPKYGNMKTDFQPSNHGRTTRRMLDDDPGV